jgi:UDP-N-acetylglucosamine--N-acetylmuramyl-(pentapeptide) pyrophosphoryl-undecaprenol N-acetylglucosamine transferase
MRVMMTGGGTGGHINPGLAVVSEIKRLRPDSEFLWVGTRDRLEAKLVPAAGLPIEFIDVAFLKGKGLFGKLSALLGLPRALWQSRRHLRKFRPQVVVGVGGFASGPVGLVAALKRIPTAILEQNARPGLTNRILGRFAKRVFIAFDEAAEFFRAKTVRAFGNPVRRGILDFEKRADDERSIVDGPVRVLVLGGSQGAVTLNRVLPDVLRQIAQQGVDLTVRHSSGRGRSDVVVEAYGSSVDAEVIEYIDDMGAAYDWADFVICRSGASTVAELTVLGKPAMFVPFPAAADNHQEKNARAIVDKGGGILVLDSELRDSPPVERLVALLSDASTLSGMGRAAAALARPDAGRHIAEEIVVLGA